MSLFSTFQNALVDRGGAEARQALREVLESGQGRVQFGGRPVSTICAVGIAPTHDYIAFASDTENGADYGSTTFVEIVDMRTGLPVRSIPINSGAAFESNGCVNVNNALLWSPDGNWVALDYDTNGLIVLDPFSGEKQRTFYPDNGQDSAVQFVWSQNSEYLLVHTWFEDGQVPIGRLGLGGDDEAAVVLGFAPSTSPAEEEERRVLLDTCVKLINTNPLNVVGDAAHIVVADQFVFDAHTGLFLSRRAAEHTNDTDANAAAPNLAHLAADTLVKDICAGTLEGTDGLISEEVRLSIVAKLEACAAATATDVHSRLLVRGDTLLAVLPTGTAALYSLSTLSLIHRVPLPEAEPGARDCESSYYAFDSNVFAPCAHDWFRQRRLFTSAHGNDKASGGRWTLSPDGTQVVFFDVRSACVSTVHLWHLRSSECVLTLSLPRSTRLLVLSNTTLIALAPQCWQAYSLASGAEGVLLGLWSIAYPPGTYAVIWRQHPLYDASLDTPRHLPTPRVPPYAAIGLCPTGCTDWEFATLLLDDDRPATISCTSVQAARLVRFHASYVVDDPAASGRPIALPYVVRGATNASLCVDEKPKPVESSTSSSSSSSSSSSGGSSASDPLEHGPVGKVHADGTRTLSLKQFLDEFSHGGRGYDNPEENGIPPYLQPLKTFRVLPRSVGLNEMRRGEPVVHRPTLETALPLLGRTILFQQRPYGARDAENADDAEAVTTTDTMGDGMVVDWGGDVFDRETFDVTANVPSDMSRGVEYAVLGSLSRDEHGDRIGVVQGGGMGASGLNGYEWIAPATC